MYYVIEIAKGDTKIQGKGIYEYSTDREAIAGFHKKLGIAMGSDLYTSDLVMVIDDYGSVVKREAYFVPVAEEEAVDETATE